RPPLGQQFAKKLPVAGLDAPGVTVAQGSSDLARHRPCEQPAAHPDASMDLPPIDRKTGLGKRTLPREDMRVDGVDERAVEIEDQCAQARLVCGVTGSAQR